MLSPDAVWIRGQREIGAGGLDHYQYIVAFRKKMSLAGVSRIYPGHAELTRSDSAAEYVWKDETRVPDSQFEYGVKPILRSSKPEWESIWEFAKKGEVESIPPAIRVQSYSAIKRIGADYAVAPALVRGATVFTGVTGSGKSHRAWFEAGADAYPKDPRTKWWQGYQGQAHVVIDEFRGGIDIAHLLRWLDVYPVVVETKGSSTPLLATHFWITSNTDPSQWYPELDKLTMDALLRRLVITYFDQAYIVPE